MASPGLVADLATFVSLMDEVSLGRFLREVPAEPVRSGSTPWPEAPWLQQWGSYFPLAAFLGSRLEMLLVQGYAARDTQALQRPVHLPLADVWATMSAAERKARLRQLGRSLLRRLLSETLVTTFGGEPDGAWVPPRGLASVLVDLIEEERFAGPCGTVAGTMEGLSAEEPLPPLEVVGAVTTVALPLATHALDVTMKDVLLNSPKMWLHQQFAEELAIVCSEHSACALLGADDDGAEAGLAPSRRSSKRQRQKLRRRQAEEEAARQREAERERLRRHGKASAMVDGLLREVVEAALQEGDKAAHQGAHNPEQAEQEWPVLACGVLPERVEEEQREGLAEVPEDLPEPTVLPKAFSLPDMQVPPTLQDLGVQADTGLIAAGRLDEWDGHTSELSSIGVATTSRSNSISEGLGLPGHGSLPGRSTHFSLLERSHWDAELLHARRRRVRAMRQWHDDSRLEFLLRNRDRFATELEWDRMSQGSVPASLDEAALYPVGLEARFAYLFDSPPRSHVTTALASQATAEDDADRLRSQWEDFEEWQSLTQALETTQAEREMWKSKAQELEGYLAKHNQQLSQQLVHQSSACSVEDSGLSPHNTDGGSASAERTPPPILVERRSKRLSSGDLCGDAPPGTLAWRYLVLLLLARRQIDFQREAQQLLLLGSGNSPTSRRHEVGVAAALGGLAALPGYELSLAEGPEADSGVLDGSESEVALAGGLAGGLLGSQEVEALSDEAADEAQLALEEGLGEAGAADGCLDDDALSTPPLRGCEARKRALHVTFSTRSKRRLSDSATQTAPAITLSKMYGGMVPRYIQRELARLRHENQLLRFRVTSLAMSQPIGRPRPIRHQGTQTAPAITFSTARQQGSGPTVSSIPRLPREISRLQQVGQQFAGYPAALEPPWLPQDCVRSKLDESIRAFVRTVESQVQSQSAYRNAVQGLCRRAAKMLWPRSTVELYGSFASGLALPNSGLDLVIYPHRHEPQCIAEGADDPGPVLSPIVEDADQLRQLPLDEVSPGHPSAVPSLASGWQQQLAGRLAQEKWVISDSIRIAAHAAIPTLSFISAPEEAAGPLRSEVESLSCPIRVDVSLEDPNHRGLRSKAIISWLLNEFPLARPVTLVLKQWLIERTYGMSHTGGLCSYGLLLMVVGFLQHSPAGSAATALVGCLTFYGRRFDPQLYGVSVARGAFLHRRSPIAWPPPQAEYVERRLCPGIGEFASLSRRITLTGEWAHRFDPLWIEDPLNPTNNVGRNCFRIRQIQRSLARAADALAANEASAHLRLILRAEGHHSDEQQLPAGGAEAAGLAPHVSNWQREQPLRAARALHEDLYQSLVEHAPNLMLPLPAHSHLPQQWDSVVRYAARPGGVRSRC